MDEDSEAAYEQELQKMQCRYRVLQNDYKAFTEENTRVINKQKALIQALEKEQEELRTNLANMDSTQNRVKDTNNSRKLKELSEQEDDYTANMNEEKTMIKTIEQEIGEMEKKIREQRKKMGGSQNCANKHIAMQKKKSVLENRLDKAMVQFNKQLAINKQLREQIDHLRQQRSLFDNLYRRLAKELEACKTEMSQVIESSTQAFEQRDDCQNKLAALRERMERDQQAHDAEMKDLRRVISHDNKVKDFMNIKTSDRMELRMEEAAKKKAMSGNRPANDVVQIQQYEEMFERIREVTGEQDIDVIVENFLQKEEENFALFQYVNEKTAEVEALRDQVAQIRDDMETFRSQDTRDDQERSSMTKSLETRHTEITSQTEKAEQSHKQVSKVLDELKSGTETLFNNIGCDATPIREMLGGEVGVSNKNVMLYLAIIEHRTTELLNMQQYLKAKRSEQSGSPNADQPQLPGKTKVTIVPPNTQDDDDSEEEVDMKPLSGTELRQLVIKGLERRATEGPKAVSRPATNRTTTSSSSKRQKKKVVV